MPFPCGLRRACGLCGFMLLLFILNTSTEAAIIRALHENSGTIGRERLNINENWKFHRTEKNLDNLVYDIRPDTPQDAKVLKPWVLPSANDFIKDPTKRHQAPKGNPAENITFAQNDFDDSTWESINLPHDWAIKGPFYVGDNVPITGQMGSLPVQGVGWYR